MGMTVKGESVLLCSSMSLSDCENVRENLTESERGDLMRMQEYLPELAKLRRFADRIYGLFDTTKDFHQASCRRATILHDRDVPGSAGGWPGAMEQLDDEKFPKLMAFLNNPVSQRVRTNNHVERTNRMVRFLEKVRYKWRRRKTLVRFVVLKLDEVWSNWTSPEADGKTTSQHKKVKRRKPIRDGELHRQRVA